MQVQRTRTPETNRVSWIVLDDCYLPIKPVLIFLKFQEDLARSPNTVRASAHHLKLFWEFLQDEHLNWQTIDVAHLAAFIAWLRHPQPNVRSLEIQKAARTDATIDQMLGTVHVFYEFHARMNNVPDLPLYQFLSKPTNRYKPFLRGIAREKPQKTRFVSVKREERVIKTLTRTQVEVLINACIRTRDRFLLALLYETGMRIGQALGLRHEDIQPEINEIVIVPRYDNINGARAKTRSVYRIPGLPIELMELYTDYLISDLNALEADHLPDYVFINIWEGEIGQPMNYETVMSLFRRLRKKTEIYVTPHMFRHTRATAWIRDDQLSLESTSQLLGHRSVETTEKTYVHLTGDDLSKELKEKRKK